MVFLIIICLIAIGVANQNVPGATQTLPSVTPTSGNVTIQPDGSPTSNNSSCTLPHLIFNESLQKSIVENGFTFDNGSVGYLLSYGSVIYHGADGITRVFDGNGTQVLIASDADRQAATPGGMMPATNVVQVPNGAFVQEDGNMTHIIVNDTCIATIVNANTTAASTGSALSPAKRVCHCPMKPASAVGTTTVVPGYTDDGLCHC